MLKKFVLFIVVIACVGLSLAQDAEGQDGGTNIGPNAIWQPGMQGLRDIQTNCASASNFGVCFAEQMKTQGASPQAVAFTRLIGNTGFLRDFREVGRVDSAYVYYPFRANENQGNLLVNGTPRVVDVDDVNLLPQGSSVTNSRYAELLKQYPNIAIFPGDRSGTAFPLAENLPGGGQRFVVSYRLTNGCRACEQLGTATYSFNFNAKGVFQGAQFLKVS